MEAAFPVQNSQKIRFFLSARPVVGNETATYFFNMAGLRTNPKIFFPGGEA
jgi:hypothetical protein